MSQRDLDETRRRWAEGEWEEQLARPRGGLTEKDRKFLWDILEYENKETEINRRQSIRERLEYGILDLAYLPMLSDRDHEKLFKNFRERHGTPELRKALVSLIGSAYRELNDTDFTFLEESVIQGVTYGYSSGWNHNEYFGLPEVDAEITLQGAYDVREIRERLKDQSGQLSPAEIGVLALEGELDAEDLEELQEGAIRVKGDFSPLPARPDISDIRRYRYDDEKEDQS